MYWALFDRERDLPGATYFAGQHDQCASLLDVTRSFSNSTKFKRRYGNLTNEQYVDLVYGNVVDRAPDGDRRYRLALLDSGELIQSEVMLNFALGVEFGRRHPPPSGGRPYAGCTARSPTDVDNDYRHPATKRLTTPTAQQHERWCGPDSTR